MVESRMDTGALFKNYIVAKRLKKLRYEISYAKKKVIFLDELPWMYMPRSKLVNALEFFGTIGHLPAKTFS